MFKEIIKDLSPWLKEIGFNKKGNSFYLENGKNYGVINFQKSRDSTKDLTKLTINFGIYSDVLGQHFEYSYNNSVKPEVEQCQWRARVGAFMLDNPDYWWNINSSDDLKIHTKTLTETIQNIVVPEIKKRLSDDGLIYSWLNDNYAGTTDLGRFKYLTILLMHKKDLATINVIVKNFLETFKGKPNANSAIEYLKEIGYNIQLSNS